jgi:hypothetical protein
MPTANAPTDKITSGTARLINRRCRDPGADREAAELR